MPYVFTIDNDSSVIRETWTGIFDLAQLMESCHAEWQHPDYRKGLHMLSDLRRARGNVTVEDVLKFASWFSNDDAPPRHAIVVRRERALDFAGIFSMISESDHPGEIRTRLFFSYAEADAWVTGARTIDMVKREEKRSSTQIAALEG